MMDNLLKKQYIFYIVIIAMQLVILSLLCFLLIGNPHVLYESVPINMDERLVYMQELMDVIEEDVTNRKQIINVGAFRCDMETFSDTITLVSFDNPLYSFYLNECRVMLHMNRYVRYVFPDYNVDDKIEYVTKKIDDITSTVDVNMSDLDKVIWINDYICKNYAYDNTLMKDDIFDMISTGEGVCSSYAQLFTLLANNIGLESSFAVSFSMMHAWNIVKIDGCWYNIDVTWNDEVYRRCYISSDKEMVLFHLNMRNLDNTIQFVACDDTRYDGIPLSK